MPIYFLNGLVPYYQGTVELLASNFWQLANVELLFTELLFVFFNLSYIILIESHIAFSSGNWYVEFLSLGKVETFFTQLN
jgi:hypothetical protein